MVAERFGITPSPETWVGNDEPPDESDEIVGSYVNGAGSVSITRADESHLLQDSMGRSLPLRCVGPGRYVTPDAFEYPTVELEDDVLEYFCSLWRRVS